MARRTSLEERLDEISSLRDLDDDRELRERLGSALGDREPLIAGKAARVAADRGLVELAPEIEAALEGLLCPQEGGEAPADPGCLGKTDLARALVDLDADATAVFLRGARCVQMEPVWGGQVDAAAELRALSALGLAGSTDRRAGERLAELLADPEAAARSGAVRALAASGRVGAELLLRFKACLGDEEPAVLHDAFGGLLELEPETGLGPVAAALSSSDEGRFEAAAIALGSSRNAGALRLLIDAAEREADRDRRKILYRALALVRDEGAAEHLAAVVSTGSEDAALLVLETLDELGADRRLLDHLAAAVDARGDRDVARAFRALSEG